MLSLFWCCAEISLGLGDGRILTMKGSQWNMPEKTPWSPTELLSQLPLKASLQAGMRAASQNLYAPSKRQETVSCYQPLTVRSGLTEMSGSFWNASAAVTTLRQA